MLVDDWHVDAQRLTAMELFGSGARPEIRVWRRLTVLVAPRRLMIELIEARSMSIERAARI